MNDSLFADIVREAKRDPLGFLWGIAQTLVVLAVAWGMLVVFCAMAPAPGVK